MPWSRERSWSGSLSPPLAKSSNSSDHCGSVVRFWFISTTTGDLNRQNLVSLLSPQTLNLNPVQELLLEPDTWLWPIQVRSHPETPNSPGTGLWLPVSVDWSLRPGLTTLCGLVLKTRSGCSVYLTSSLVPQTLGLFCCETTRFG